MFVLLVQPPALNQQEPGHPGAEPPSPPWDLVCLHSYLQNRTGHRSLFFDGRLHTDWRHALEQIMPADSRQLVVVVRARIFELPAALCVLRAAAALAPEALKVLCGPVTSARPAACAQLPDIDAVLAGDPEPGLRQLLDNRHAGGRLRQTAGIALRGRSTDPYWWPDLHHLPTPAWDSLPWKTYTDHARGGVRALLRVSRGHPGQAADRAQGGVDEPLRFWDFDRLAPAFGKCAHLGVVETLVMDPPGIWTVDRLRAWCEALRNVRNTHPWALQLLPRTLSPDEAELLLEVGCRRIELILPSPSAPELARYGLAGDPRSLHHAVRSIAEAGLEVLLRCWVGGPGDGRGETRAWIKLARRLRYPPMRFQVFPLALDAPLLQQVTRAPGTPTFDDWLEQAGRDHPPVAAWGGAEGHTRASALSHELNLALRSGWWPRLQRFWMRWRAVSVIEDLEYRARDLSKPA